MIFDNADLLSSFPVMRKLKNLTSPSELTFKQKQSLCREHHDHEVRVQALNHINLWYSADEAIFRYPSESDRIAASALEARMVEIKQLVGQDCLDEYAEKQQLKKTIEAIETRLDNFYKCPRLYRFFWRR